MLAIVRLGSRMVLAVTPAERQLTLRFRAKSLQRGSRQFRASYGLVHYSTLRTQTTSLNLVGPPCAG
jgi:hypothetical protein